MRVTDKAADSGLTVPVGLKPDLIGKLVVIQVFKKEGDTVFPESLKKHVGVLKSYTLTELGVDFILDGVVSYKTVFYDKAHVEFILYQGT